MSQKYYDRLLVGTGSTSKEVKSAFGEKLMAKMGWKKGDGLGKSMDGIIECIQIKRRDENLGMGAELETPTSTFKWNDKFWDKAYNDMAAKFSAVAPKTNGKKVAKDDTFDEMIEIEESNSDSDDAETSFSSFEGELIIEKSSKPLMKIPKKNEKMAKLEKSKAIKKDKKKKNKK